MLKSKMPSPDIFSSANPIWDPKLARKPEQESVMNKIVGEIEAWEYLETFKFPQLPRFGQDSVRNVDSVMYLLSEIVHFIKMTEDSGNTLVYQLLSASIQSEASQLDYVWGVLCNNNEPLEAYAMNLLGQSLYSSLTTYQSSRDALQRTVLTHERSIGAWKGAYCNGEATEVLEHVYKELHIVHKNFQAWKATVSVAVIRNGWDKHINHVLSMPEFKFRLDLMYGRIKQTSMSPNIDPSSVPKKHQCVQNCFLRTEFLYFSRGKPLHSPEIKRSPTRSAGIPYQRRAATSETGSSLSISPRNMASSWPESELGGFGSIFATQSMSNHDLYGGASLPTNSPPDYSPGFLQSGPWVEDSTSISEVDAASEELSVSEIFAKMNFCPNQSGWPAPADNDRPTASLRCDEVLMESTFQGFQDILPGQESPYFWPNLYKLASISEKVE